MREFIPGTYEREIAPNIVFRPIKSWHSATYAGERITIINGDRSGCMLKDHICHIPSTVTHRIYWNKVTKEEVSAFLSYPNAMGCYPDYFWEIYSPKMSDCERFGTEIEMETRILSLLMEFTPDVL